jgi:PAP2 superfamily
MGRQTNKGRRIMKEWLLPVIGLFLIGIRARADADAVTDWNRTALATQSATGDVRTPPTSRALAMVHAAIYDAVNAIDRQHAVYAVDAQAAPGASPEAAAVAAAHAVLTALYPTQQANLDAAYLLSLAQIPDGTSKTDGISLGELVAAGILTLRASDGSTTTLPYTQPPGPGIWQPTPPAFAPAVFVAWGEVTPFTLRDGSQFRAEGPPALTSSEYAADFNEVKSLGAANSSARTAEQTQIARFWAENSQITWNNIARLAAAARQTSLSENARLFALLNLAAADTAIAVFDSKYAYNFWRPVTAIRAADTDGNDDTTADPTWTSLVATPAHPDYTSQHSAFGGVASEVLASFFGTDDIGFSLTTSTAPGGVVRSFDSFSQAAEENMRSRVYIGFHFPTACRHGLNQGRQVGHWVFQKFLRPVGHPGG